MFGSSYSNPNGYIFKILEEVCEAIVDCPHSTPNHKDELTKYPSIRTTEIRNGQIEWSSMKYVEKEEYEKRIVRLRPKANDIIYAREGSYGDAAILPDGYNFCLGQRVLLLRANLEICNPIFLWQSLRSEYVLNQAKSKNVGCTVGHVNVGDIKKFDLMLPPLMLQNQFAAFVNQVDKLKFEMQKSLKRAGID